MKIENQLKAKIIIENEKKKKIIQFYISILNSRNKIIFILCKVKIFIYLYFKKIYISHKYNTNSLKILSIISINFLSIVSKIQVHN